MATFEPSDDVWPGPKKCGRSACDNIIHEECKHTQSGVSYCLGCARRINDYHPGLVSVPIHKMEPSR